MKALYRVAITAYVMAADDTGAVTQALAAIVGAKADVAVQVALSVEPVWQAVVPQGESDGRTCQEILKQQRAALSRLMGRRLVDEDGAYRCRCGEIFTSEQAYAVHSVFCRAKKETHTL